MITKEQCRTLSVGDYLLFFNTWRRIQGISQHPRGNIIYFKFIKIKGVGMTLYTNHDLKYKVKGALKHKTMNNTQLLNQLAFQQARQENEQYLEDMLNHED